MDKKRSSFTGNIGFVLAAAGSAVGLGNLWRFPYLAAKDGGGVFLLVYLILSLTFGFTLMTSEIALGRKTRKSSIKAYSQANKSFGWLGNISFIVPFLILPYYCVIGGWVTKYMVTYITGHGSVTVDASGTFFNNVIGAAGGAIPAVIWFLIFSVATSIIVYFGVDKGIEKASKILMPVLVVIIIFIAAYSLTLKDTQSTRTAIDGLKIYLIPNFEGMNAAKFFRIVLDAMSQMFYSMSLAMGIMITYGSYSKRDENLIKSVNQIEIFDTGIAFLAGLIMIPAVFCFMGGEGLNAAGPSLMFISLPQVFNAMGFFGNIIGALFFILVLFAALTSSVSLLEAVVSMLMDIFQLKRGIATTISVIFSLIIGIIVCLGYNVFYFDCTLPNGSVGQILDIFDWFTNNLLMPIVAIATCILIGWFTGTEYITDEVSFNGEKFRRKGLYIVMVKYVAPLFLLFILLNSFGIFDKLLS